MHQVTKEMLETMMPKKDAMVSWNLHSSFHCKLGDVVEIPKEIKKVVTSEREMIDTYVLPKGS